MPRNMSFALTTQQFIDGTKDVTRRKGWRFLKSGDLFMAVEKAMGLKKGEKMRRLGLCRAVSVRREPLSFITVEDVRREGFPTWTTLDFVNLYIEANGGDPDQEVTRIEFERIREERQ